MKAHEVFAGSDGAVTRGYYAELVSRGAIGVVAMNLFRAQKSSARAKKYRGGVAGKGSYRGMAYEKKAFSMCELCAILAVHGAHLGIAWGWKVDSTVIFDGKAAWVLYVDLPQGQVSFHSPTRGDGPAYERDWDQCRASEIRILQFCDCVMEGIAGTRVDAPRVEPRPRRSELASLFPEGAA
jgi:hypothetical protein